MEKGYLSLVLHAHLPFAHHPESEGSPEERRLFEAITDNYLPFLDVMEGLIRDRVQVRLALAITPTLLAMLSSPLLQERYLGHLNRQIVLAEKKTGRVKEDDNASLPRAMTDPEKLRHAKKRFADDYGCKLIDGFKALADSGHLELMTSSATHAILPYLLTEQALRAQIANALKVHTAHFGQTPQGIWLPECAYQGELDRVLREFGLAYFMTDGHAFRHAEPQPSLGVHAPVRTPGGMIAFALDPANGRDDNRSAGADADDFLFDRTTQLVELSARMDRKPVITACCDAASSGPWRHEGPVWLDRLCRKIDAGQGQIKLTTPSAYLREYAGVPLEECRLIFSTRGSGGFGEAWLNGANQWTYRRLHEMEEQMIELAERYPYAEGIVRRALNQAARELLLAQSSDWPFMMGGAANDYAVRRFHNHAGRFGTLRDMLRGGIIDKRWLDETERRDGLFPELDYRDFLSGADSRGQVIELPASGQPLKVLMLAWEYPPFIVGGLSRHVYDLSRRLAGQGTEVHVVTCHADGCPSYERDGGVHIHRVRTYQNEGLDFMDWIFQLNLAMADYISGLIDRHRAFDLIHAHDWLVHQAAKTLKHQYNLPLVATIHATEHGRNQGIRTWLQRTINHREWELSYEAWRVIVCSSYMEREMMAQFRVPADKLDVIPNGVVPELVRTAGADSASGSEFALPHEKVVFFVGRLVREKGVHVLLESVPAVLAECPEAKFVIAGKGPMLEELQSRAGQLGIGEKVLFAGFIDDTARNRLFRAAYTAVFPSLYEPFGIVALEAMAANVPVVVSGVGGLAEIVSDGEDGFTVLPGDVRSLESRLIWMLKDEGKAKEMAENALRKASTVYDWGTIAERTMGTYRRVLREKANHDFGLEAAATIEPTGGRQ